MLTRRSLLLAMPIAGAAPLAALAGGYPSGPVKIIVNFPPGGSTDVITRAVAVPLQSRLGKPVVVENRAGAGGIIAAGDVAKAVPDGLTLLSAASSLASNATLYKSLPYNTLKDLRPVSLMFRTPLVLVVNPKLPVHSVAELIALLKRKPGQIDFGHGGLGSAIYLAAELLQTMTGTKMNPVAYRGAPLALNDLIAGRISLMFADAGSVIGQIDAGQVRALGVSSPERVPKLRNVPTIAESGVPGFDAVGWSMICVPAHTPQPIIDTLNSDLAAALQTPKVASLIVRIGTLPVKKNLSPPELETFLASEIDRWGKIITRAGAAGAL
jgi:tripartite-type tricarboxylate transporter receptor subunit TctC